MNDDFKIPTLDQVFACVDDTFKYVDLMDNTYKMINNNYIMRYHQNRGITLRNIFIRDMLNWLCFLGWGDGYIHDNEVLFINEILDLNLSQKDVFEVINSLNEDIIATLPMSFAIFMEYDALGNTDVKTVEILYMLFFLAGTYFISCDGDIDDDEVKAFLAYTQTLRRNIDTFNLRLMHEYILNQI